MATATPSTPEVPLRFRLRRRWATKNWAPMQGQGVTADADLGALELNRCGGRYPRRVACVTGQKCILERLVRPFDGIAGRGEGLDARSSSAHVRRCRRHGAGGRLDRE